MIKKTGVSLFMSDAAHIVKPTFTRKSAVDIPTLNVRLEAYEHIKTGALHYHFQSDYDENVFLVGLRTVPMDNKGVAHILEHTALCGSQRYPVRDPFFMMIRRSLNTFMNAFTSNDWTAYPFASQNRKDFANLLSVYLDAVFFANLNELDFLQEGHRLAFSEDNEQLVHKGVVYNEMKGAMSSTNSVLWQMLCRHLFPTTTYHFNSGGEPDAITDLKYQELKNFYQKHYHPSNAIFMTFGDINAAEHQAEFEEKVLQHFSKNNAEITIGREKRFFAPLQVKEAFAHDSNDPVETANHHIIGWLLGCNTSLTDIMQAQLLSYVLLENSASPLQHYLETTSLGSAPSALCGLEDSYHELIFICGISGTTVDSAAQFQQEVLTVLEKVANEGIPYERLEAILHQIELSQREISGDSYPYGLQLILAALPGATHRGDPLDLLDIDETLEQLKQQIKDPTFIKDLVKNLLIDNGHRVDLTAVADKTITEKKSQYEKKQLANLLQTMSENDKQRIIEQTQSLEARQNQIDDPSALPKVTLQDIPKTVKTVNPAELKNDYTTYYAQGTNGLIYQQLVIKLPSLNDTLQQLLPLYCQSISEMGFVDSDYLNVQNRQSAEVGSISAYTQIKSDLDDVQKLNGYFILSAKALAGNTDKMNQLLKDTLLKVTFNEQARLKEIVSQIRMRKTQSVTGNGHVLALNEAASLMSPLGKLRNNHSGLPSIQAIKALDEALKNPEQLKMLATNLTDLHQALLNSPKQLLCIAEADKLQNLDAILKSSWSQMNMQANNFVADPIRNNLKNAWIIDTQVNFCAAAFPTVAQNHPDNAALNVLGGILSNGFLHNAIREKGGAYGAGAMQDSQTACFKFYSYRDPRLQATLDDFTQSINWLIEEDNCEALLEEAILGIISSQDKPGSPAGEAKKAFYHSLFGVSQSARQAFREQILSTTVDDIKAVTKKYLLDQTASLAVITTEQNKARLAEDNWHIHHI